jgi:DNA-binding GntR family transcriptional regulator
MQIAEQLRREIQAGTFGPGEKLPTGRELERQTGVSINTVQRALDLLRRDGLIYGIQGKGNFVRSDVEATADQNGQADGDLHDQVAKLSSDLEDVKDRLARLEQKAERPG